MTDGRTKVLLLPGVVMPPDLAYGPLRAAEKAGLCHMSPVVGVADLG